MNFPLGSVVQYRGRPWVVQDREGEALRLRPLGGGEDHALLVHPLVAQKIPWERLEPGRFPPPRPEGITSPFLYRLFEEAATLLLRESVAPLRSISKVSVRPRPYQLVPLLMALRLRPVRLLIADDVGVGKTIEAGLVVRELLDSKEARRVAVLVPPHLMEQWVYELREKFALEAVPISPATLARLERDLPPGQNVYTHYPVQVISIDFVKHPRHRPLFLESRPDVVVVDEAHGAVGGPRQENQMRYTLVRELAEDPNRHLLLLTATPHSGIPDAFQRLLGLLQPEFQGWSLEDLTEERRARLARHFVQRTRRDVLENWEGGRLFPERIAREVTYLLSPEYRTLYDTAYSYARKLVRTGEGLGETQRRFRWWAALALLRAVMSSPRAAQAALARRQARVGEDLQDTPLEAFAPQVFEAGDLPADDEIPTPLLALAGEEAGLELKEEPLRALRRLAQALTPEKDSKLQGVIAQVRKLLEEGHEPVVWCHYVDTAEYVAEELRKALPGVAVAAVTGRMDGELRREAIAELMTKSPRVLVATDCVSEGINLQAGFSAAIHYDLPWNPNRLEQREGRVDRYGQPKPQVVVVRYYGGDNPMDRAVLEVLLRKAEEIRNALGIHVPVPREEAYVVDRMVRRLFYSSGAQPLLLPEAEEVEREWQMDVERERKTRTRFAQWALKPAEAMAALKDSDAVLGTPERVERFVLEALERLGLRPEAEGNGVYRIPLGEWLRDLEARGLGSLAELLVRAFPRVALPVSAKLSSGQTPLRRQEERTLRLAFQDPVPEGALYVGRNHPLVVGLARYAFERALRREEDFGRYTALRTSGVDRVVYLYLLRPRYLLRLSRGQAGGEVLGEEVLSVAYRGGELLPPEEAQAFLRLSPEDNVPKEEAQVHLERALRFFSEGQEGIMEVLKSRARKLQEDHRRVRQAAQMTGRVEVVPADLPDLLGVRILVPKRG